MAGKVTLKLNSAGVVELLKSEGVLSDLADRADAIAAAAGPGFESDWERGPKRARASVRTTDYESRLAEARERALTRAIDAGRSG
ncbi:hypothetical protein [Amycolatopsis sp. NPDC003731]